LQYVDVRPVLLVAVAALVLTGAVAALTRPPVRGRAVLGALLAGAVAVTLVVTLGPVETSGPSEASLNLVPFRDIRQVLRSGNAQLAVLNLGGNTALFAPVGALLALLLRRWPLALLLGVGLSVVEEGLQYATGRAADVDDVLLNGAGVLVGVLAGLAVRAVAARRPHPHGRPPGRA
jgi:glycopeptide antibiotics resistance protein